MKAGGGGWGGRGGEGGVRGGGRVDTRGGRKQDHINILFLN